MAGPPSPKRQRTGEKPAEAEKPQDAKLQAVLEAVGKVEEEIDKENDKLARELLAIESKYNRAKRPFFEKRGKLLREIPGFWKHALANHPYVAETIADEEEEAFAALTDLDVQFIDDNGGFKIALRFDDNPLFGKTTLWKQVVYGDDGEVVVTASPLKWKTTPEAKKAADVASFLKWFTSTDGEHDIAEHIKDEIWKSPLSFYVDDDEDDEHEEDDEEDEEDEGEEDE